MALKAKRCLIIALLLISGFVAGNLAVRMFMNLLMGGIMFGGDIL